MHHQGRHNIMCLIYLTRLWFRVLESPLKLVRCYTDLFVLSCNINVWKFLLLKKIFSPDRVLSRHCHTILDWETNVRGNKKNYLTFPQKIQNKITMKVKVSVTQSAWLFATPWTVTHQAPPSMGFSRQEYWSGLPCPPPGDLPHSGMGPRSLMSPTLAGGFLGSLCYILLCVRKDVLKNKFQKRRLSWKSERILWDAALR